MPGQVLEFDPASRVSVGAVGRPGQRVFFLQAVDVDKLVNLKLEKQQVFALSSAIDQVLDELEREEVQPIPENDPSPLESAGDIEADLIAAQIGLAFDRERRQMLLLVRGLALEEDEGDVVRIWASLGQMRALSRQAREVVAQGRPICPVCQQPIDPDGHFCPGRNGHSVHVADV